MASVPFRSPERRAPLITPRGEIILILRDRVCFRRDRPVVSRPREPCAAARGGGNTPRGEGRPQLVNGIPSARVNSRFSVCGLGSLSAWPIFLFSVPVRYLAGAAREKLRDASFVSLLGFKERFKEVSGCCVAVGFVDERVLRLYV